MTKKAHITLASHIADRIGLKGNKYRKFIFYSGNIWPDVSIMFLIKGIILPTLSDIWRDL